VYGIIGEDRSDVETLTVLVRRLSKNPTLSVKRKGFDGGGNLLRGGARELRNLERLCCDRFIICHDADGPDPAPKRQLVEQRIVMPSGIRTGWCILIPVQELEAWILADIECATKVFPGWRPSAIEHPESVPRPKEHLYRLSRDSRHRPRYNHATHNEKMANHLDLEKVSRKCPAFRELVEFVGRG
jgi:hypothetical protein